MIRKKSDKILNSDTNVRMIWFREIQPIGVLTRKRILQTHKDSTCCRAIMKFAKTKKLIYKIIVVLWRDKIHNVKADFTNLKKLKRVRSALEMLCHLLKTWEVLLNFSKHTFPQRRPTNQELWKGQDQKICLFSPKTLSNYQRHISPVR